MRFLATIFVVVAFSLSNQCSAVNGGRNFDRMLQQINEMGAAHIRIQQQVHFNCNQWLYGIKFHVICV